MDGRTSLEDDDFDRLMQLQGWARQDFSYEATENNHNVIGQIREASIAADWSRLSSDAFFFHFEDTTFRKLLRYILSRRQCSRTDLLKLCSNGTVLDQHLSYMLEKCIVVSDNDLWKVSPRYEHIPDLGKTLEWYVAEWFYIRLKVPTRYRVHIKGLANGGDLDVVAFPTEKPVIVECKTSRPDTIENEELHLFLQRIAYFKPLKALLLVDTENKIDSLSDRLRKIYVTSEIVGPFSSTGIKIDLDSVNVSNTRRGLHSALSSVLDNSKSDCDKPFVGMSLLDTHKIAGIVPGLNKNDSQVLKLICEKAIKTENSWINLALLNERAETLNIPQDSLTEAIDVLEKRKYIKRHSSEYIEILIDGFEEYAKIYIDDYQSTKSEIASSIISGRVTPDFSRQLALSWDRPLMLIEHILDYFDKKELIRLARFVARDSTISITNISPLLKRAIRDGEEL
jgi:hypothetical protein